MPFYSGIGHYHLHGHLKNVILEYGPLHGFWCFSFERYNGIMGKHPTNNRSIESQLMKKFLRHNITSCIQYPDTFTDDFANIISSATSNKVVGSLSETFEVKKFQLSSKYRRALLSSEDICAISSLIVKLNSNSESQIHVNSIFCKHSSVSLKGKVFCSSGKNSKPTVAMAKWDENLYGLPPTPLPDSDSLVDNNSIRPVDIKYYANVSYTFNSELRQLPLASVSWFFPHEERYAFGKPAELWCKSMFESYGTCSFVPIENILCRCAHCIKVHEHEDVLVFVPLVE